MADAAEAALISAANESREKKARRSKCMIGRYGIFCILQLLGNEPALVKNRSEILRQERLEAKKIWINCLLLDSTASKLVWWKCAIVSIPQVAMHLSRGS